MKRLAVLFCLAFLSLYANTAHAQSCNTPSGFIQTEGEIPLGNTLILGPDCNHVRDGGAIPIAAVVYTSQCGIKFDGVTDDTAAWNSCISTYAGAKTILAPCGVSIVNTGNVTINLPSNAVIVGVGPYCTALQSASTTADVFRLSGSAVGGCKISNLSIDQKPGVTRTAGAGINALASTVNGCDFNHLLINNQWNGIALGSANYAWTSYLQVLNSRNFGLLIQNPGGVGGAVAMQWKLDHNLVQGSGNDGIRVQAVTGSIGPLSFENWNSVYTFNNAGYGVNIQCLSTLTCFGIRINDSFFGGDGLGEIKFSTWNGGHIISHTYMETPLAGACLVFDNTNSEGEITSSYFLQCAGFAIDVAPTGNFTITNTRFNGNNAAAGSGATRANDCAKLLYPPGNYFIGTGPEVNCTTGVLKSIVTAFPTGFVSRFQTIFNTVTTIDFGAGSCRDSTDSVNIVLSAGQTKNLNASWVAGSGNGGLQSGLTFSSGTFYYLFAIYRSDIGTTDYFASDNPTAPTLPTSYTNFCRFGAILTELASAQVRPFTHDLSTNTWWLTTSDRVLINQPINATPALLAVRVPAIQGVQAIMNISVFNAANAYGACIRPGFSPCVSTVQDGVSLYSEVANGNSGLQLRLPVNSSRQISVVGSGANGFLNLWVLGWQDNF